MIPSNKHLTYNQIKILFIPDKGFKFYVSIKRESNQFLEILLKSTNTNITVLHSKIFI